MRVRTRRRTEREGESSAWIQIRFRCAEFRKNLAGLSRKFAAGANRRFEFQKRGQLFIRLHNEMLSVAMALYHEEQCNKLRGPGIKRGLTWSGVYESARSPKHRLSAPAHPAAAAKQHRLKQWACRTIFISGEAHRGIQRWRELKAQK